MPALRALGDALGLDTQAFGLWAGTAVNDTSSVVAVAATYGDGASRYAVVVMLTRTLLLAGTLWIAVAGASHRISTGPHGPRVRVDRGAWPSS